MVIMKKWIFIIIILIFISGCLFPDSGVGKNPKPTQYGALPIEESNDLHNRQESCK